MKSHALVDLDVAAPEDGRAPHVGLGNFARFSRV